MKLEIPLLAVIAVGALGAGACAVGPRYAQPKVDVPESYKEAQGWKVAEPAETLPRGAWWQVFHDPELNALEEKVSVSNQTLAVAEAQYRQQRALLQATRAGLFPTATVGASVTRTRPSGSLATSAFQPPGARTEYSLPADVSWELDVWGKARRSVEASRANAQASAADVESVRLSVEAALAQDYFLLRAVDAQKQLLDDTLQAFEKSLELTKNRYAVGVASKADVLQAETQLTATRAQAIDLGVQRAQLEHALALLLGQPPAELSVPVSPLAVMPPIIPLGLPSELLERRPDVAAAERRVAAANAGIGAARTAFFPSVTLAASGGFQSSKVASWLTWPARFWSLGPAVLETVFDAGLRRAQARGALAAYDANVAAYRQTVLTGFQEVEDNVAALRILEQEAEAQQQAVESAGKSLEVTTNQYKAGIVSYLEVTVSQVAKLANERAAIDVLSRRLQASVLLIKALGGGWEGLGGPKPSPPAAP